MGVTAFLFLDQISLVTNINPVTERGSKLSSKIEQGTRICAQISSQEQSSKGKIALISEKMFFAGFL